MTIQITGLNPSFTGPVSVAPYAVDTSKGGHNGTVSRQWSSRPADQKFNTLGDLYRTKAAYWDASWESRADSQALMACGHADPRTRADLEDLNVAVKIRNGGDVVRDQLLAPTHYSFGQLAGLGGAPASYLRTLPGQLAADNINWGLHHNREVEQVKLFASETQLHAATGPTYGRIPDHEIIRALMNIAGDGLGQDGFHWKTPGRLNWSNGTYDPEDIGPASDHTFYGSDRDMFVFLVDDRRPIVVGKTKDGHDDHMFRGFFVQNSMVGARSLKIAAFYLRGVCMNRNLWGVENFEEITIRHTSMAMERWVEQARPALESFSQASDRKLIEGVAKAKEAIVAADDDAAVAFLKARKFSQGAIKTMMEETIVHEDRPLRSAWDMAQAMTRYAQVKVNNDDRLEVELVAKQVLDKVA